MSAFHKTKNLINSLSIDDFTKQLIMNQKAHIHSLIQQNEKLTTNTEALEKTIRNMSLENEKLRKKIAELETK